MPSPAIKLKTATGRGVGERGSFYAMSRQSEE